jgi:hypothetical protein
MCHVYASRFTMKITVGWSGKKAKVGFLGVLTLKQPFFYLISMQKNETIDKRLEVPNMN